MNLQNLLDNLFRSLSIAALLSVQVVYRRVRYAHFGIDNPIQIFLTLFTPTVTAPYASKELRVPVDTLAVSDRGFLALPVFNPSLRIRSDVLVSPFYSLRHFMPQPLRLSLVLLLQRASAGWCMLCMCSIE